jgi:hypothetical protein
MQDHWLARPATVRLLWRGFLAVLALTVATEFVVERDAHFTIEGVFAFGAWYGFLACAGLILGAKAIGAWLKRPDRYYDEERADDR